MNTKLEATGKPEEVANKIAKDCIRMDNYIPQEGICWKFGEYEKECRYKGHQPDYIEFQLWLQGARL